MPTAKKRAGIGATVNVVTRLLHPTLTVKNQVPGVAIPNNHITVGLTIVRRETKSVRRTMQRCYILHHPMYTEDDGSFTELHTVCRHIKITAEGPPEGFFLEEVAPTVEVIQQQEGVELPTEILANFRPGDDPSLLANIEGIQIDDDNQPAPENVGAVPEDANNMYGEWGFPGFCERRRQGFTKHGAQLRNHNGESFDLQTLFEHLFPIKWIKEVLIPETNAKLPDGEPLTYGEFLRWLGLWFLMTTTEGCHRKDFWCSNPISMFEGAPYRFGDLMSRNRFTDILANICYTSRDRILNDRFYEVREMVDCWNENMATNFRPSWVSCLDESMSPWTSKYTCPGYMYVPRKPWPFGNEYHSVACGLSRIMWGVELVEGKDAPNNRPKKFEDKGGATVGLLLRLCEPVFYTGICLVLDSGFCVLKGLIELRKVGVFAASVIKKRRYWPKYINGDVIDGHFNDKAVGAFDVLPGTLDGVNFGVYCMKEPDYVMKLMATYGTNKEIESLSKRTVPNDNTRTTRTVSFHYTELFANHFAYRNAVDAHNQLRHQPISLEVIWATKRWANRVFAFLLAISEVNVKLASEYFNDKEKLSMLAFRKLFAKCLIYNRNLEQERQGRTVMNLRPVLVQHELLTTQSYRRWNGAKFVRADTRFPQRQCGVCKRKVRTYCGCNPSRGMCNRCHIAHVLDIRSGDPHGD
jgi:Transposase IS4